MTDDGLLNKHQRKKAARKARQQSEREAHRSLDTTTSEAISAALEAAPGVAGAMSYADRVSALDVVLASDSEAQFVRKRVNDALSVGEWLTEVRVLLWRQDEHLDEALTESGAEKGFELRLEQVR